MASFKTSALAGALILAATGAFAADMPYPAPPPPPPMPAPAPDFGGWYLRGDIGFSSQTVDKLDNALYGTTTPGSLHHVNKDFDSAPFGGVGVGYQFNQWLRADVTGEYRASANFHGLDTFQFTGGGKQSGTDVYTGSKSEWTGLVNVYADLGTWSGFTPFVGGGVGLSRNTISNFVDYGQNTLGTTSVAYAGDKSKTSFAWALQAGLAYEIQPGVSLEFAYRYLHLGDAQTRDMVAYDGTNTVYNPMKFKDLNSQDFKFGVRWALDAPVAASAPAPTLVRRY